MSSIIRRSRIPITPGLIGKDKAEREKQVHELNNQLDELFAQLTQSFESLDESTSSTLAGNFVLHGLVIPSTLPGSLLHKDLAGADLHDPKAHKDRHASAGSDAFISTDLLEAKVKRVQDDVGSAFELGSGGWSTGQFLKVSGSDIISEALATGASATPIEESLTFSGGPPASATLSQTPVAGTLQIFWRAASADLTTSGWVLLVQDALEQYTLSGTTVTLTMTSAPTGAFRAFYWY